MKTQKMHLTSAAGLLACLLVAILVGCESSSTNTNIEVDPPSATISRNGSARFTAIVATNEVPLFMPLVWSVDNHGIGRISDSAGLSAVYIATGPSGNNTITVKDQGGREGIAVVTQE